MANRPTDHAQAQLLNYPAEVLAAAELARRHVLAKHHLTTGDIGAARTLLGEPSADHLDLWRDVVEAMLKGGQPERARAILAVLLKSRPHDAALHELDGCAASRIPNMEAAERGWEQARRVDPRRSSAYEALLSHYVNRGDYAAYRRVARAWRHHHGNPSTAARVAHDAAELLQKVNGDAAGVPVRAALLGTSTLDFLRDALYSELFCDGFVPALFTSAYGQLQQEILDPHSALFGAEPEIIFLTWEAGALHPGVTAGGLLPGHVEGLLKSLRQLVAQLTERCTALVVVNNLPVPSYLPIRAPQDVERSQVQDAVQRFNAEFTASYTDTPQVVVFDYDHLVACHGRWEAVNPKLRSLARMEYSESFVPVLARAQAGYVKAVKGRGRKCIVVDLDDTLWGGIVGEDGIDGIHLGETPPGNIFADFQRLLRGFHDRGILLAINSKNNPEDALEVIRDHPAMVLREEHFTAMRINWQDKVTNLREIAAELNLGLDSFVFVDDNPAERLHVEQALPEVLTVDLPRDSAAYRRCLEQLNDFTVVQLTPEDMSRTSMYRAERQRRSLHESSASLDEFLASLRMEVSIEPLALRTVRRAAQLVQRTNQFNLTTRRYSDEDLRRLGENGRFHIWTMAVRDVFGDNGIVGLAIVEAGEEQWRIDTFLMSCRVLGRRLEDELLGIVANEARTAGVAQLLGTYRPTKKNGQVQDFYRQRGFRLAADQRVLEGDTEEAKTWVLDLPLESAVRVGNRHAPQ